MKLVLNGQSILNYDTNYETIYHLLQLHAIEVAAVNYLHEDYIQDTFRRTNKSSIKDFTVGIKKEWNGQAF
jgi:hypothetical protein